MHLHVDAHTCAHVCAHAHSHVHMSIKKCKTYRTGYDDLLFDLSLCACTHARMHAYTHACMHILTRMLGNMLRTMLAKKFGEKAYFRSLANVQMSTAILERVFQLRSGVSNPLLPTYTEAIRAVPSCQARMYWHRRRQDVAAACMGGRRRVAPSDCHNYIGHNYNAITT